MHGTCNSPAIWAIYKGWLSKPIPRSEIARLRSNYLKGFTWCLVWWLYMYNRGNHWRQYISYGSRVQRVFHFNGLGTRSNILWLLSVKWIIHDFSFHATTFWRQLSLLSWSYTSKCPKVHASGIRKNVDWTKKSFTAKSVCLADKDFFRWCTELQPQKSVRLSCKNFYWTRKQCPL